jgi:peptidoglycan hydrolase-like protein with peptidoglycan-binding domain
MIPTTAGEVLGGTRPSVVGGRAGLTTDQGVDTLSRVTKRAFGLALLIVVSTATAAGAHSQPNAWKNGDAVGQACGLSSGTYVKSWQSILWGGSYLANLNDIDGLFGPATASATRSYQSGHSLSADGCAGYYT